MPDHKDVKDILWAPWRHSYIMKNVKSLNKKKKCFLCEAWASRNDKAHHVLLRTPAVLVMLNRYPYNNGHIMIAPGRHVEDISEMSDHELQEMSKNLQRMICVLKKVMNPHGFNTGMNLGLVSGAGEKHVHMHVVPRWYGDTNFMPICSSTKVISQSLSELYKAIRKALNANRR